MELVRFGLSEDLSISRKEAMEYIEHYFNAYPGIKAFLDRMVEQGHTNEYVTTMFGRRRPIPEIKSSNYNAASVWRACGYEFPHPGFRGGYYEDCHDRCGSGVKEKRAAFPELSCRSTMNF